MSEEEYFDLLDWSEEMKMEDFKEFVQFIYSAYQNEQAVITEYKGVKSKCLIKTLIFNYKRRYNDFDLLYMTSRKDKKNRVDIVMEYLKMEDFKKNSDQSFTIKDKDGNLAFVSLE